eukprot:EG_transcript_1896
MTVFEPRERVDCTPYFEEYHWMFDDVFDENDTNQSVYHRAARPLVDVMFAGGYATCFAFGQTGSGKTHTTLGSPAEPGLFFLAAEDIFWRLPRLGDGTHLLGASFYEIYQRKIYDLLQARKECYARESRSKKLHIAPLSERVVSSAAHLKALIREGTDLRQSGATGANSQSSRSHAILQIALRSASGRFGGQLSFIDLAGSERGGERGLDGITEGERQTLREGIEINRSLLALKECIRALDAPRTLQQRIPFRDSKLTEVLRPSFTGTGAESRQTVMIATIAPSAADLDHTLNTLRYAYMVKQLKPLDDFFGTLSPPPASPPTTTQHKRRPRHRKHPGEGREGSPPLDASDDVFSDETEAADRAEVDADVDHRQSFRDELRSQLGQLRDQVDLITTRRVRIQRPVPVEYPPDEEDAPTSSGGRRVNVGLEGETVKKVKYFVEDEPTSPLLASAGSPPAPLRYGSPSPLPQPPPATWPIPRHEGPAVEGPGTLPPRWVPSPESWSPEAGVRAQPRPQPSHATRPVSPDLSLGPSGKAADHPSHPVKSLKALPQARPTFEPPSAGADTPTASRGNTPSTPVRLGPINARKPPAELLVHLGGRKRRLLLPASPPTPDALKAAVLQLFDLEDCSAEEWLLEWWSARFGAWVEVQDAAEAGDGTLLRLSERVFDARGLTAAQACLRSWLAHHHLDQHFPMLCTEGHDDIAAVLSQDAAALQRLGWPPGHAAKLCRLAEAYRGLLRRLRAAGLLRHLGILLHHGFDSVQMLRAATPQDLTALGLPAAHARLLCQGRRGRPGDPSEEEEAEEDEDEETCSGDESVDSTCDKSAALGDFGETQNGDG